MGVAPESEAAGKPDDEHSPEREGEIYCLIPNGYSGTKIAFKEKIKSKAIFVTRFKL